MSDISDLEDPNVDVNSYSSEEEEDEQLFEEPKGKRRRKASSAKDFLNMEADEDEDEDEEDWTPGMPVRELEPAYLDKHKPGGVSSYQTKLGEIEQKFQDNEDNEELDDVDEWDDYREAPEVGELGTLLPSVHDPSLWSVRLWKGKPRDCVIAIAAQAQKALHEGTHFPIVSCFASSSVPNTLYIEAFTLKDVQNGIKKLPNLNRKAVSIVPMDERASLFKMTMTLKLPEPGSSVKIKRGVYEDDIAEVVSEHKRDIIVKLVPRIHIDHLIQVEIGNTNAQAPLGRPAPKLISMEELHQKRCSITQSYKYGQVLYEWMKYSFDEEGYVYRPVKATAVSIVENQIADVSPAESKAIPKIGDVVVVTRGDLRNIKGTVIHLKAKGDNTRMITLRPLDNSLPGTDSIEVLLSDVKRCFNEGDSVRIISGANKGCIGLISAFVNSDIATVYIPENRSELDIDMVNLEQQKGLTSLSSGDQIGFSVGDLLSIEGHRTGVVTSFESGVSLKMLFTDETSQFVPLTQVRKKLSSVGSGVLDNSGRNVTCRALVTFDEAGVQQKGRVIHVWNSSVFIRRSQAAGAFGGGESIVVCDKSKVELDGARDVNVYSTPGGPVQEQAFEAGRGRGRGGPRLRRGHHFGRQVRIINGRHKGLIGNIQGQMAQKAQIMIQTTGEQLHLEKEKYVLLPDRADLSAIS